MKSFFRNKLGSKLALAALAVCFFAVPGKAQDTHESRPAALVCTSYPEWSCEPQTVSSQDGISPAKQSESKKPKTRAGMRASRVEF